MGNRAESGSIFVEQPGNSPKSRENPGMSTTGLGAWVGSEPVAASGPSRLESPLPHLPLMPLPCLP